MKVIELFGEPSAGKTATMLVLTGYLKRLGLNAEIASEYYKDLVYQNTPIGQEDDLEEITKRTLSLVEKLGGQLNIYATQYGRLKRLEGTVDFAITDCPLPLIGYYSRNDANKFLYPSIQHSHSEFDNIGFLIKRTHDFESRARVHSEVQAQKIADELPGFLKEFSKNSKITNIDSCEEIESVITFHLMKEGHLVLDKSKRDKVEERSKQKLRM